jgi:hypothetical protein
VWVFNGAKARLASGVFSSRENAEAWIARHKLTGLLTEYPLDFGAYDWAVQHGLFRPKRPDQGTGEFIGAFTNPHLQHFHYEDGRPTGRRA